MARFLNTFAFVQAATIIAVLRIYQLGKAPAERTLVAVRVLFLIVLSCMAAESAVASSDSWDETASTLAVVAGSAAIIRLYILGELNGFALKIGKAFSWFV